MNGAIRNDECVACDLGRNLKACKGSQPCQADCNNSIASERMSMQLSSPVSLQNDMSVLKSRAIFGQSSRFVQSMGTCHARRIFRSTSDRFGTGPRVAKPGDVCCIIFGARLPLVLRKKGPHWEFVGECVLEGVMNSEAMRLHETGALELREFSIYDPLLH